MIKKIKLCLIGLMCFATASAFAYPWESKRYSHHAEMINKTIQKTISETILVSTNPNRVLIRMTDGSLWMHSVQFGGSVNIEDFQNPQIDANYNWVTGYDRGFDMEWTENRNQVRLLAFGSLEIPEALPYDFYSENFEIIEILNDQNNEILVLNNSSIIVMPPHHRGFSIGDIVKISLMKQGKNGYLFRQIDEENKIIIPLDRGGPFTFIGR